MNKDLENISSEELAADPDFKSWILGKQPETNSFWENFLQKNPEKQGIYEEAKLMVLAVHKHFKQEEISKEILSLEFQQLLVAAQRKNTLTKNSNIISWRLTKKLAAIAAIILLLLSSFWFWNANQIDVFATGYGEWKSLHLPDGSHVELNSNSKIRLARSWFFKESRDVWLEGEAFFDVKNMRESNKRFQVITKDLSVEVLGTSFNVHSRGEQTEVFLEEGEIKLDLGEEKDLMEPGNWISYSKGKKKLHKETDARDREISSWKDGVLVMKEMDTQEIFEKIEEIYGVKIQVENEAIHRSGLTLRVPMKQLEMAIPILENTLEIKIIKENERLLIQ